MTTLYGLLELHRAELSKLPDWVRAWNELHQMYTKFKEEQRKQQEEMIRSWQQAMKPKADVPKPD